MSCYVRELLFLLIELLYYNMYFFCETWKMRMSSKLFLFKEKDGPVYSQICYVGIVTMCQVVNCEQLMLMQ